MKPTCKLIGEDGNVFNIIGCVSKCLKNAKQPIQAAEFVKKAFASGSYDEVLQLAMQFVEVV